jgi:hypothetical protein
MKAAAEKQRGVASERNGKSGENVNGGEKKKKKKKKNVSAGEMAKLKIGEHQRQR